LAVTVATRRARFLISRTADTVSLTVMGRVVSTARSISFGVIMPRWAGVALGIAAILGIILLVFILVPKVGG
jgi:hypothetical protein